MVQVKTSVFVLLDQANLPTTISRGHNVSVGWSSLCGQGQNPYIKGGVDPSDGLSGHSVRERLISPLLHSEPSLKQPNRVQAVLLLGAVLQSPQALRHFLLVLRQKDPSTAQRPGIRCTP